MPTSSVITSDGIRIVYEHTGDGPAIILLHGGGGGQSRASWKEFGYVDRLCSEFRVIAIDIRGHGEGDKPIDPSAYSIERMGKDVLEVADACQIDRFVIWGFSFGGNIGRYLAAQSKRVAKIIIIGVPFGAAATGDFLSFIEDFRQHWEPQVQEWGDNVPDLTSLSEDDKELWTQMDVPVTLAWLTAMLDWGENHPWDLRCPALWLAGTENKATLASIQAYEDALEESPVQVHLFEGLNHIQEFEQIDTVFPAMLAFTQA